MIIICKQNERLSFTHKVEKLPQNKFKVNIAKTDSTHRFYVKIFAHIINMVIVRQTKHKRIIANTNGVKAMIKQSYDRNRIN